MALRPELRLRQSQRLALTPGLRQSINILQLPAASLADLVAEEVAENPFLDYQEPHYQGAVVDHQIALDTIVQTESLPEFLGRQIRLMKAPQHLIDLACYLAWNLTDDGFLADDPWTISEDLGVKQDDVRKAARLLQSAEPAGIGAYGLKHSLELQLAALDVPDATRTLILNNLRQFSSEPVEVLARELAIKPDEVQRLRRMLQSLTPRLAKRVIDQPTETLVPDIRVEVLPGSELHVEQVDRSAPMLELDSRMFQTSRETAAESAPVLEAQYRRAQDLIRAIGSRKKTILRIGQELCAKQARFFLEGPDHLQPMTQVSMAQELDLNPSTLSRAVAHKSLVCAHGVFPLSFFFTAKLGEGDRAVSAYVVQQEIQRMIKTESPSSILSDAKIATQLGETGVDIARRTVAKYRQCLNIPSSTERRRSKRFL